MNAMNTAISRIGVVPVIKLNHPERDAVGLAKALCAGGVPVAHRALPRSRRSPRPSPCSRSCPRAASA